MKFTLTIELGNDGMQSLEDLAATLKFLAFDMPRRFENIQEADIVVVRDRNGNTVGRWEIK